MNYIFFFYEDKYGIGIPIIYGENLLCAVISVADQTFSVLFLISKLNLASGKSQVSTD